MHTENFKFNIVPCRPVSFALKWNCYTAALLKAVMKALRLSDPQPRAPISLFDNGFETYPIQNVRGVIAHLR